MASLVTEDTANTASLDALDAKTRAKADARIEQLGMDANRYKLRHKIRALQQLRTAAPSRAQQQRLQCKKDAKEAAGQRRLVKEQDAVDTQASSLEDNVLTSSWKGAALHAKARLFVQQHVDWAWALFKQAYVKYPKPRAAAQFKFVAPDTEHFDSVVLSVMILVLQGHVWGVASTDMDGITEMVRNAPEQTLLLRPGERLDRMPADPYFSKSFDKGSSAIKLKSVDMELVPFLRPPFWAGNALPSAFVQHNVLSQGDYDAMFPTVEQQLALSKKVAAHCRKLDEDRRRAEAQVETEKAALK